MVIDFYIPDRVVEPPVNRIDETGIALLDTASGQKMVANDMGEMVGKDLKAYWNSVGAGGYRRAAGTRRNNCCGSIERQECRDVIA